MEIQEINGSLLESGCTVLAHQVNCMGVMGSGVARAIKEKWIDVYLEYLRGVQALDHNCLGGCLIVKAEESKFVANIFGQYYYSGYFKDPEQYMKQEPWKRPELDDLGKPVRFTNYEALYTGLNRLKTEMIKYGIKSVAFPYGLGSVRAGGNWEIVKTMIIELFKPTDILVEIRKI